MNKKIIVMLCCLFSFLFTGIAAAADLAITNKTGFELFEVHFAPADSGRFGDDVLNMNVILNNETVTVHWNKGDKTVWNIMVLDEQNNKYYWNNLNLSEVSRITLKPQGKAD